MIHAIKSYRIKTPQNQKSRRTKGSAGLIFSGVSHAIMDGTAFEIDRWARRSGLHPACEGYFCPHGTE